MKIIHILVVAGLFLLGTESVPADEPSEELYRLVKLSQENDGEIARLIDAGANINYADDAGVTILMKAVEKDRPNIVALLLRVGADISPRDKIGRSAHYIASRNKYTNIINLLQKSNALSHSKDRLHSLKKQYLVREYLKRYDPRSYFLLENAGYLPVDPAIEEVSAEEETKDAVQYESRLYFFRYISDSVYRACYSYGDHNWRGQRDFITLYVNEDETLWVIARNFFSPQELVPRVPEYLRGDLFEPYIQQGFHLMTRSFGVYGLLLEFSAHAAAMNSGLARGGFIEDFPEEQSSNEWRSYFSIGNRRCMYYWELKYYILSYLLHAKENYPDLYRLVINDYRFKKGFTILDNNYSSMVEKWEDEKKAMLQLFRQQGYYTEDFSPGVKIWIGRGSEQDKRNKIGTVDLYGVNIDLYKEELQKPEYREVYSVLANTVSPQELYDAAAGGDLSAVTRCLESGVSPDSRGGRDFLSCLEVAAQNNHLDVVKALLEGGARLDGLALGKASEVGNIEMVRLLLNYGARTDMRDDYGMLPLNFAAYYGHTTVAQLLVNQMAPINSRNNKGWTPLHSTAVGGHAQIARLLINKGANPHAVNSDGLVVADIAAKENHPAIAALVKQLPESGRNAVETPPPRQISQYAMTLLIEMKVILSPNDIDKTNDRGLTKLMHHAKRGNVRKVQLLLEAGADTSVTTRYGDSALSLAAEEGYAGAVEVLLDYGVDPNSGPKDSSLMEAAMRGHPHVVQILLERGADTSYSRNNKRAMTQAQWFLNNAEKRNDTEKIDRAHAVIRLLEEAP